MESNKTSRSLFKATILSFMIAMITLVLFILPAEYNIDPTGVGEKLGLTVFNNEEKAPSAQQSSDGEQDTVLLTVPAGKGIEYKLDMNKFQKATYQWTTDLPSLWAAAMMVRHPKSTFPACWAKQIPCNWYHPVQKRSR